MAKNKNRNRPSPAPEPPPAQTRTDGSLEQPKARKREKRFGHN
ncbi:hypothetical protein [Streptomyces litchfieldiae]|uniref:Uncharacterized protein n=1 Tax=Streptomyces litchfieldiae TaxID=3075543 RepID=A0ABU2MY05_9ACTN|nr:hypothetical protein [Streptomyces sp. DSM 44938]MDT0346500.1 hypothetical protein [Streptomyces sp. DSM 44938]